MVIRPCALGLALLPALAGCAGGPAALVGGPRITTVAVRVLRMDAMLAFYEQAFGVAFRPVDTSGLASWFGELGPITLKFVPLRGSVDFAGFGTHRLGVEVRHVAAVIEIAARHGGRQEGPVRRENGRAHAAVRDPDGNTIELYERR